MTTDKEAGRQLAMALKIRDWQMCLTMSEIYVTCPETSPRSWTRTFYEEPHIIKATYLRSLCTRGWREISSTVKQKNITRRKEKCANTSHWASAPRWKGGCRGGGADSSLKEQTPVDSPTAAPHPESTSSDFISPWSPSQFSRQWRNRLLHSSSPSSLCWDCFIGCDINFWSDGRLTDRSFIWLIFQIFKV